MKLVVLKKSFRWSNCVPKFVYRSLCTEVLQIDTWNYIFSKRTFRQQTRKSRILQLIIKLKNLSEIQKYIKKSAINFNEQFMTYFISKKIWATIFWVKWYKVFYVILIAELDEEILRNRIKLRYASYFCIFL